MRQNILLIQRDAKDAQAVKAMRVVAEGVETREQLEFLIKHDCSEGQGYHFSQPLKSEYFADFLSQMTGLVLDPAV